MAGWQAGPWVPLPVQTCLTAHAACIHSCKQFKKQSSTCSRPPMLPNRVHGWPASKAVDACADCLPAFACLVTATSQLTLQAGLPLLVQLHTHALLPANTYANNLQKGHPVAEVHQCWQARSMSCWRAGLLVFVQEDLQYLLMLLPVITYNHFLYIYKQYAFSHMTYACLSRSFTHAS